MKSVMMILCDVIMNQYLEIHIKIITQQHSTMFFFNDTKKKKKKPTKKCIFATYSEITSSHKHENLNMVS